MSKMHIKQTIYEDMGVSILLIICLSCGPNYWARYLLMTHRIIDRSLSL